MSNLTQNVHNMGEGHPRATQDFGIKIYVDKFHKYIIDHVQCICKMDSKLVLGLHTLKKIYNNKNKIY